MDTFRVTLIVKGPVMLTHAKVLNRLKGIHFRYESVHEAGVVAQQNYMLHINEECRTAFIRAMGEWLVEDIHVKGGYPNGSLLYWGFAPEHEPASMN